MLKKMQLRTWYGEHEQATWSLRLNQLQAYGGEGGAGLLSLREDKALHEPVVTSVNRRHPLFMQFRPWPLAAAAGASQPADAAAADAAPAEPGTIPAGMPSWSA